ncbi:translocation/assembly module TamB domain-containing protein [Bartonella sp. F02]|uniref:translocation/assembly module TamB domain-containing protein n=1 Tax=Bartonella sp. F02 TaxID=2967262 RepID=UPI0022A94EC4|nr:translocation/assembly module TamB domain-containing protein [Bartonella sp. F02]MCZ2327969.1 translocation/assembly module TamB domain-containing protein [Bartonella sp. F02]
MKKILRLGVLLFGLFFLIVGSLFFIQKKNATFYETQENNHSWLVSFIEKKLSTPNRHVRLYNVQGTLSSKISIDTITISDNKGVWLKIANAEIDWNRLALLRGRVDINQLSLEHITFLRKPKNSSFGSSSRIDQFSIPKLPLSLSVNTLVSQRVTFEKDLFGCSADVSLKGHLVLTNSDINADIKVHRLDAPGYVSLLTTISNKERTAKINIFADEPQNGILANILNVEKRPALNLAIEGDGTFDDLVVALHLDADHKPILDGDLTLIKTLEGHSFSTNLSGIIDDFVPVQYRHFFESEIILQAETIITKEGATRLDHMTIQSKEMNFEANAELTKDGFLRQLFIDGKMAFDKVSESTTLEAQTHLDDLTFKIDYGRKGQPVWKGQLVIHNLINENVHIRNAVFDMGGVSENLDSLTSRHVGIQINGNIQGITSAKNELSNALNQTAHVHLDADIVAGKPIFIHDLSMTAQGFSVWLKGKVNHFVFSGDLGLKAQTLELLGLFSGKPLSGGADIKAKGTVNLVRGAFDLELSGNTDDIKVDVEALDRLFKGNLILSGNATRNMEGFVVRHLRLKNKYTDIKAKGHFSNKNAKMDFYAQLSDLTVLNPKMNGAVIVRGAIRGHHNFVMLSTHAHVDEALFVGKKLQNTMVNVNVLMNNTSLTPSFTGFVKGRGVFAEKPLQLSASFDNSNRIWKVENINIKGGDAKITGDFSQTLKGFMKGNLHIDADNISTLAALFLQKGSGSVKGDFVLDEQNEKQKANLKINIDRLNLAKNKIKKLEIQADIFDPFGAIQFEGFANAEHVQTPLIIVNHFNAHANGDKGQTVFDAQATLHDNIKTQLSGYVTTVGLPADVRKKVQLETLDVKQSNVHATLLKPVTIIHDANGIVMSELGLTVNGGTVSLVGNFYDALNLRFSMNAFPVSLVNLWKPDLGARGTLTGDIMIRGHFEKPEVSYVLNGKELTIAAFEDKKITPFAFLAKGKMVNKNLIVQADLTGEDLHAQTQGTISLDNNKLDLKIDLQNVPAHLANGFITKQALSGMMMGQVGVGGTLKDPLIRFELSSKNLTVITHKGLESINMNARGSYKKSTFHIEHMVATGFKELDLSLNGHVPLNGSEIGLNVKGTIPLVLIDPFLAERGAYMEGIARIETTLNGTMSEPSLIGNFSVANGHFFDSQTNFGLNNIVLEGKSNGDNITLERAYAYFPAGGSVSVSGNVSSDLQTDLAIHFDRARYNDGSMIFATLTGNMTVTGPLLSDLLIGGNLTVEKAEILVPDHFRNTKFLDIKHKNLTQLIQKTLEYAEVKSLDHNQNLSKEPSAIVRLNMNINARNKFFVRGRGLDVELGGRINLAGPLHNVRPVGEFQMIRGRFDILSRRLNFDQGQASFNGNLNPTVYFVANSNSGDTNVTVTVSGTIDNINVNFSSQPVLPQDEVLARLIFNRSLNELSPLQIAQLAAAAAELAGASNTSLLNTLRAKIGLDDLDVVVDEKGNTGLRIGRYIHDNIYLGLEAGSNGKTKGTVNLDISRNLKAKGAIGNDNDSSFGLFYEKDY